MRQSLFSILSTYYEDCPKQDVHRCLTFVDGSWFQPWITCNDREQTQATKVFTSDLFKLMNNAVPGKVTGGVRPLIGL